MSNEALPSFRKPPVVETVLGVQFDPIRAFSNAHLGAFWKHFASTSPDQTWDMVNDAPAIATTFERFDKENERTWEQGLALRLSQDITNRIQIRKQQGDAMVQLQNGRLHYNWIGHGGQEYPRYITVLPLFQKTFEVFQEFLQQEGKDEAVPNQWEVTYVNHIRKGTVWNDISDWPELFVGLPGICSTPGLVRLEALSGVWHFEIIEKRGRLHVDLKHARLKGEPSEEILRLTVTARGPINVKEGGLTAGLDLGHRVVVSTFKGITSPIAHEYWELEK